MLPKDFRFAEPLILLALLLLPALWARASLRRSAGRPRWWRTPPLSGGAIAHAAARW
jgi:hypothetical protein